jgi:hypothetical protein
MSTEPDCGLSSCPGSLIAQCLSVTTAPETRYDGKTPLTPIYPQPRPKTPSQHGTSAVIFDWKTKGRGRTRVAANSDAEIADALRLAVTAKTERAAIAVLCGLHGVQIPVASAILAAIDPLRFTIIDFRALEALGIKKAVLNIDYYLAYLSHCRELASKHGVTLRQLEQIPAGLNRGDSQVPMDERV